MSDLSAKTDVLGHIWQYLSNESIDENAWEVCVEYASNAVKIWFNHEGEKSRDIFIEIPSWEWSAEVIDARLAAVCGKLAR